jgi:hypothetical protein
VKELDQALLELGEAISRAPISLGLGRPYDDVRLHAQALMQKSKEQAGQITGLGAHVDRLRADVAQSNFVADRAVHVTEVLKLERKDLYDQLVAALGREAVLSTRITIIRLMLKETETLKIGIVEEDDPLATTAPPTSTAPEATSVGDPLSAARSIETTYLCDVCGHQWSITAPRSPGAMACPNVDPKVCLGTGFKLSNRVTTAG